MHEIKHGKNTEMCLGARVVGHNDAFLLVAKRQQQRVDAARFASGTCYSRCERDFILKKVLIECGKKMFKIYIFYWVKKNDLFGLF